jgi:hypothetical protein
MGDLVPVIATLASIVSCSVLCKDPAGMKRKFRGRASAFTACGALLLEGTGVGPDRCLCKC